MSDKNFEVEVERINGEIKLIHEKIDTIKNNHLAHLKVDIDKISKLVWTVGIIVFTNFVFIIRDFFF